MYHEYKANQMREMCSAKDCQSGLETSVLHIFYIYIPRVYLHLYCQSREKKEA